MQNSLGLNVWIRGGQESHSVHAVDGRQFNLTSTLMSFGHIGVTRVYGGKLVLALLTNDELASCINYFLLDCIYGMDRSGI